MKRCPNPSCPHRRRVGSAAEFYDEKTACSDCGAELEAASDEPAASAGQATPRAEEGAPSPLKWRLAVTILVPLIAIAAQLVTLPYIDAGSVEAMMHEPGLAGLVARARGLSHLSVVSLGITP